MDHLLTRLVLPAEIASLRAFTEFVRRGAQAAALPEREQGHLDLVLEEILVNVMSYAYPDGVRGTIEVSYTVEGPGNMFVQVSDGGRAFDPLAKDPPDLRLSLAERPIGGLGIFLVKQITQSLHYSRVEDRNVLSFQLQTASAGRG